MYHLAPAEVTEVEAQITDMLEKKLTEPYVSPIHFVKKKSGELRMLMDYIAVNKLTVKNHYSLPSTDDPFDQLHGAEYFSSLHAASGFHQIPLKEEDSHKVLL